MQAAVELFGHLPDHHHQRDDTIKNLNVYWSSYRLLWNYVVIFLSLIINVMMLWAWDAPLSLSDFQMNSTSALPSEIFE